MGIRTGDMVRVTTEIGHFVDRVWVTEAMKPGVVACSHHLGRWRRKQDAEGNRWSVNLVDIAEENRRKVAYEGDGRDTALRKRGPRLFPHLLAGRAACTRTSLSPCTPIP